MSCPPLRVCKDFTRLVVAYTAPHTGSHVLPRVDEDLSTMIKEGPIDGTNPRAINVQPDQLTVKPTQCGEAK